MFAEQMSFPAKWDEPGSHHPLPLDILTALMQLEA